MYPNLLRKRVALTPDRIAFEMNGTSYSWSEVYKEVECIAQRFLERAATE